MLRLLEFIIWLDQFGYSYLYKPAEICDTLCIWTWERMQEKTRLEWKRSGE